MLRRVRRVLALVGLLQVAACSTWQRPKTTLTPDAFVTAERPDQVLVTTKSGRKITLPSPEVAGDSLVAGVFSAEVPRTERVVLTGVSPSDITVLRADEAGYRQVRISTDHETVVLDDPVFSADTVTGTQSRPARPHRVGVPVTDIRTIEVRAINVPLTTLSAVAGGVAILYTAAVIAFMAEMN